MRIPTLAFAAVLLSAGSAAIAAPCYVIYDRNDAVIYRDHKPPFDLSVVNSREREMMRRQGQHLLVAEFLQECNPVGVIWASTQGSGSAFAEFGNPSFTALASRSRRTLPAGAEANT